MSLTTDVTFSGKSLVRLEVPGISMRVVAEPVNLLVAIHDGASVSRTNPGNASAGALLADLPFGVLFRVGIVLRRVFKELSVGLVMPFSVFVLFGISFAMLNCW